EEANLRRLAETSDTEVVFEVTPSRARLRTLFWGATALLYPVHEDFGIVPVEAQACGTPVIGLARGGLLETVKDGETGFLFKDHGVQNYARAANAANDLDRESIVSNANQFSAEVFS